MIKSLLLLTFLCYALGGFAQDSAHIEIPTDIYQELALPGENQGRVKITEDTTITNLIRFHIQQNQKQRTFIGYRIQIYSGNSYSANVEQLKLMRDNFEKEFINIPAYLKYIDPDFKIRVGNFRTRLETIPALHRIKKKYPASYPVKTEITLDELKHLPLQNISQEEVIFDSQQ